MTCDCADPIVFGCYCTRPRHGEKPRPRARRDETVFTLLCNAEYDAHPAYRNRVTTHWVMNLDWYKAIRRASLPPDLPPDDEARDETKWEPQHGDMVLGYNITVTEDGGEPHLVDGGVRLRPGEHIIPASVAASRITEITAHLETP